MAATAIILVNWNGHADTIECLESLLRLEREDFAVVIVDNGSTDGSIDTLRDWAKAPPRRLAGGVWDRLPADRRHAPDLRVADGPDAHPDGARITVIPAGRNLGYAAANNVGMAFGARDPATCFFWLLNNDTVARPDSLAHLAAHADAHPDLGLIGSTLLYYDAPDTVQGVGGWIEPHRALAGHIGFGLAADALPAADEIERRLAYVMGASMFVPRATYAATGGMSEAYFLYFEEPDWARRLPAGVGQGVCLDAVVYHKEGGSIGTDSIGRPSDTSLYYYTVNTLRYYWRHERRFVAVAAARIAWNAGLHAKRRDAAGVGVTLRACVDALTRRRRRGPYGSAEFRSDLR